MVISHSEQFKWNFFSLGNEFKLAQNANAQL